MRLVTALPDEPPLVCCDPTLLRIVLLNLLDNAVKYGREGGEVRLTLEIASSRHVKPQALRFSVRNAGPGFSQADRNRLFRRFSRLDDPELKRQKGTGVGLYSAWRIVQLHRGHISADSKKGEWAQFCVEIPATLECPVPQTTSTGETP